MTNELKNRESLRWLDRLGVLLGASLLLCSLGDIAIAQASRQPQSLPVGAKLVVGQKTVMLEMAQTPSQQARGLMYRRSLPSARPRECCFPWSRRAH